MRYTKTLIALLATAALLTASSGLALAKDGDDDDRDDRRDGDSRGRGGDDGERGRDRDGKPHFGRHGGDKWLLQNDEVSVWFKTTKSGKAKPELRVFHTGDDGNVSGYAVSIKRLVEFGPAPLDDDHDDDDRDNESGDDSSAPWDADGYRPYARMNLAKMDDWNVETTEDNESLHITMVRAEAQGIVKLLFHVNKTAPGVKFDLEVDNWRWADNATGHKLALVMITHDKTFERRSGEENVTLDGGYISWAPNADVTYETGVTRSANVTAHEDREDGRHGRLTLVFDAPGGYDSLVYDPEFGVVKAQSVDVKSVPTPGVLAVAGAAATVAFAVAVLRRRS